MIINVLLSTALLGWWHFASASSLDLQGLSPEDAAQAISDAAEDYHEGWTSSRSRARMVLFDDQGKESQVKLQIYGIEQKGNEDTSHSYIVYDNEGTGLLTYMYRNQPDVQWVWVPGLKRKWRIQAKNVTGAFVGSEFAYEDFRSQFPQKFALKLLGETEHEGEKAWLIERRPTRRTTNYSRQEVIMDQAHFRVLKTDFYYLNERHLKTLTTHDWSLRADGFWRSSKSVMRNHQTGRVSHLVADKIELDVGLVSMKKFMR